MSVPLSELPAKAQTKLRDELAERAIELIKNSPQHQITAGELINKLADEFARSEQEVHYVIRYMIHKRMVREAERKITEGPGIPKSSRPA